MNKQRNRGKRNYNIKSGGKCLHDKSVSIFLLLLNYWRVRIFSFFSFFWKAESNYHRPPSQHAGKRFQWSIQPWFSFFQLWIMHVLSEASHVVAFLFVTSHCPCDVPTLKTNRVAEHRSGNKSPIYVSLSLRFRCEPIIQTIPLVC